MAELKNFYGKRRKIYHTNRTLAGQKVILITVQLYQLAETESPKLTYGRLKSTVDNVAAASKRWIMIR